MVTFPNKKHRLLMVKLKYQLGRLITSLLPLTLASAVLMLGSPAFAHELSGSTCGADVVFLWDQKHFQECGLHGGLVNPPLSSSHYCGGSASMVRKPGVTAGPRDHFKNTKIASTSGTSGRISWTELQQQKSD